MEEPEKEQAEICVYMDNLNGALKNLESGMTTLQKKLGYVMRSSSTSEDKTKEAPLDCVMLMELDNITHRLYNLSGMVTDVLSRLVI